MCIPGNGNNTTNIETNNDRQLVVKKDTKKKKNFPIIRNDQPDPTSMNYYKEIIRTDEIREINLEVEIKEDDKTRRRITSIKINKSGKGIHSRIFNKALQIFDFQGTENYNLIWLGSTVKKGGIEEEADYELFDDDSYRKGMQLYKIHLMQNQVAGFRVRLDPKNKNKARNQQIV